MVFITVASLCTLGFAAWVFLMAPVDVARPALTILGGFSALIGLGLIGYGIWFRRKSASIIL